MNSLYLAAFAEERGELVKEGYGQGKWGQCPPPSLTPSLLHMWEGTAAAFLDGARRKEGRVFKGGGEAAQTLLASLSCSVSWHSVTQIS